MDWCHLGRIAWTHVSESSAELRPSYIFHSCILHHPEAHIVWRAKKETMRRTLPNRISEQYLKPNIIFGRGDYIGKPLADSTTTNDLV